MSALNTVTTTSTTTTQLSRPALVQNTGIPNQIPNAVPEAINHNPDEATNDRSPPVTYSALGNANNSTIRGASLNIQA